MAEINNPTLDLKPGKGGTIVACVQASPHLYTSYTTEIFYFIFLMICLIDSCFTYKWGINYVRISWASFKEKEKTVHRYVYISLKKSSPLYVR